MRGTGTATGLRASEPEREVTSSVFRNRTTEKHVEKARDTGRTCQSCGIFLRASPVNRFPCLPARFLSEAIGLASLTQKVERLEAGVSREDDYPELSRPQRSPDANPVPMAIHGV